MSISTLNPSSDLLTGADQISTFLFGDTSKRRRIYNLAETANLPIFKMGKLICARKSKLLAWIEEQEKAA